MGDDMLHDIHVLLVHHIRSDVDLDEVVKLSPLLRRMR